MSRIDIVNEEVITLVILFSIFITDVWEYVFKKRKGYSNRRRRHKLVANEGVLTIIIIFSFML